jgi:hypothetical protein
MAEKELKSCYDLQDRYKLDTVHCSSCHEDADEGYTIPYIWIVEGERYWCPCCLVQVALEARGIEHKEV